MKNLTIKTPSKNISQVVILDIAHEALINHWPRLHNWIDNNRQFKAWRDRFGADVKEWSDNNQNKAWLLRSARLVEAEKWLKERSDELTADENDYIKASIALREHDRQLEWQHEQTQRRFRTVKKGLLIMTLLVPLSLIFIHQFFYHFGISRDGFVEVRHGIRELGSFAWPLVETALNTTLISEEQAALLREGNIIGFWPGHRKDKIRLWWTHILPRLDEQQRQFTHLLITGSLPKKFIENTDILTPAWRTKLAADSFFIDRAWEKDKRINWLWNSLPNLEPLDCSRNIRNNNLLIMTLIGLPSDEIITHLAALESYVLSGLADLADLEKTVDYATILVGYRLWYENKEEVIVEFKAFQKLLQAVQQKQKKALDETWWSANDDGWCDLSKLAALSQLGNSNTQAMVQQTLIDEALKAIDAEQNNLLNLGQNIALLILEEIARQGNLSAQAILIVFQIIKTDEYRLEGNPELIEWIGNIAAYQELPDEVKKFLFEELYRPPEEFEFYPLEAFYILARNTRYLNHNEKQRLLQRLPWLRNTFFGFSRLADGLGYIGCVGFSTSSDMTYLEEKIGPYQKKSKASNKPQVGSLIQVSDFEIGVALGRIAQHSKLPKAVYERLFSFAINRLNYNVPNIEQVYKGLAVQRSYSPDQALVEVIKKRLAAAETQALVRKIEIQIAIAQMMSLTGSRRQQAVEQLRHLFEQETEPEQKIALGTILIEAEKPTANIKCHF